MTKRPIMCGKPTTYIPDIDCDECMIEVNKLRREMEECCDEVKGTLTDHDGRITTNEDNISALQNTVNDHETRITDLEDCCAEVQPEIQNIYNEFSDYYTKSETYTQAQVDNLISQIETGGYEEVSELPETGDPNVIYLVPKQGGGYDRWIYSNGAWKDLGGTDIDLSNYVRLDQVVDMIHPVGDTVIRTDNVNPGTLYTGTTWQLISQGKVLIGADSSYPLGSSANGSMTHNHTNPTTGGSSAANTGGPSNNTSGSTTLTAAQSGLPSHNHPDSGSNATKFLTVSTGDFTITSKRAFPAADTNGRRFITTTTDGTIDVGEHDTTGLRGNTNATQGHTHTLSSHTHSMAHTHTQGNTGDATIPHLAVNIWLRTA